MLGPKRAHYVGARARIQRITTDGRTDGLTKHKSIEVAKKFIDYVNPIIACVLVVSVPFPNTTGSQ